MDHDKDDSMDDVLGSIPPSISVGSHQNGILHLAKGTNFGALLENDQNLFEGIIGSSDGIRSSSSSISHMASPVISKPDLPMLPPKRTLPSLYWTGENMAGSSSSKRFQGGINGDEIAVSTDGNSSVSTLLGQLPQTPQLHQQTMLGSMGDGVFRPPYQISNMNWYS